MAGDLITEDSAVFWGPWGMLGLWQSEGRISDNYTFSSQEIYSALGSFIISHQSPVRRCTDFINVFKKLISLEVFILSVLSCPKVKWNSPTELLEPQSRRFLLPYLNYCSAQIAIFVHIDIKSSSVIKSEWAVKVSCTEQYGCSCSEQPTHPTDSDLIVLVTHQLLPTNVQSTWGICTTWATGVNIHPRPHTFPSSHYSALNIIWAYIFKEKKKNSCINKT